MVVYKVNRQHEAHGNEQITRICIRREDIKPL